MKRRRTIFNTPVVRPLMRALSLLIWKVIGWRFENDPPRLDKFVFCCAPHTSYWDFAILFLIVLIQGLDLQWMGKQSLFPWPFGWLMKWMGGIPIDRSKSHKVVEETIRAFNESERMVLVTTPEGTRRRVKDWKTGFYHIALGAGVPICPAYIDVPVKQAGFFPLHHPGDDVEEGIAAIRALYVDKTGFNPS